VDLTTTSSKSKMVVPPINEGPEVECNLEIIEVGNLLEWTEEDFELESFTLVQSRKKKKSQLRKSLKNSGMKNPLRRSSRITPSIYREGGGQENPAPGGRKPKRGR
jgi:hypothetical protein